MPGIKPAIQDVLTRLNDIIDSNGITLLPTVRIWNNQLAYERKGEYPDFAKPAAFVEVINNVDYHQLGGGMQIADIGFNIHLVHEWYDAQDGTFEDDLVVFDLRDNIVTALSYFMPTGCNEMIRTSETVDNDHDNLYHLIIQFVTNLVDSTVYNYRQSQYTAKQPPTDLEIDAYIANSLVYSNVYTVAQPTQTLSTSITNTTAGQTVFFVQDSNGASIAGATISLVINNVMPLRNNQWSWDKVSGFLTITDNSVYIDSGVLLTILYTVIIS
jgi:hypothetical protein